jgi:hypothetical protein
VLSGRLLAESLRLGHDLQVADLTVTRVGRHDVTGSTVPEKDVAGTPRAEDPATSSSGATGSQPSVWTFIDFEAPDDRADELARALADALLAEDGWWADFTVGEDHVVVFANKVFRYRVGDVAARNEAIEYGLAAGTPRHQLDWGD